MTEVRLSASVSDECKLVPMAASVWLASLSALRGKRVVVTIATERVARSLRANRYWWGLVVVTFQEIWSIPRVRAGLEPYTKDETHGVLVEVLAGCDDGPLPGSRVRKRTSEMTPPEFAKLIEDARELGREQYGIVLPEPGERFEVSA